MTTAIPLADATAAHFGGKAAGLARLIAAGLRVPDGLVVPADAPLDAAARAGLRALVAQGPVAARSSATVEDGALASAAGQFATVLDVSTPEGLWDAIRVCRGSLESDGAARYLDDVAAGTASERAMNVVVQRMVNARAAGVLFTDDPRAPGTGRLLIEAVHGLGESLVAGHARAEQIVLTGGGELTRTDGPQVLTDEEARALAADARRAERALGEPLDLEWAIGGGDDGDGDGRPYWLQARPITTNELPTMGEFDHCPDSGDRHYTRLNVGEMLPGAATPLTLDVFGGALNYAMTDFYGRCGALAPRDRGRPFVCSFSGHLWFDLTLVYGIAGRVAGTSPEGLDVSLLGRELEDRPAVHRVGPALRLLNLARYGRFALGARGALVALRRLAATSAILPRDDHRAQWAAVDSFRPVYDRATALHMQVSTASGALNAGLRAVLERAGLDRRAQMEALGKLLSHVDGVESAQVVAGLEEVAALLREQLVHANGELSGDAAREQLAAWVGDPTAGAAGRRMAALLAEHGHRCVREAELRTREWGEAPDELYQSAVAMALQSAPPSPPPLFSLSAAVDSLCERHPRLPRRAVGWTAQRARDAVRNREEAKSHLIRVASQLRHAYRHLGELLTGAGLLPDGDLVWFLTHVELGALVRGEEPGPAFVRRAAHRRRLLPRQAALRFPDFAVGPPQPLRAAAVDGEPGRNASALEGMPVSAGVAEGPVRVLRSLEDAHALEPGEILCAASTDIGWTPYYGLAAGMVTEMGSSLSHGAVVAREYGLPLVTGVDGATMTLRTGDRVEVDGSTGAVRILARATFPAPTV